MNYTRINWTESIPLTPANLNIMDEGIWDLFEALGDNDGIATLDASGNVEQDPKSHNNTRHSTNYATETNFNNHRGARGTDEHDVATDSEAGFMSSSDKDKLDDVDDNANNYSLETHDNTHHSPNFATAADLTSHENEVSADDDVHGLGGGEVKVGSGASAGAGSSIAIGLNANSDEGGYGVAIGRTTEVGNEGAGTGYGHVAIGYNASTLVNSSLERRGSIAIGYGASAPFDNAMALGNLASVGANQQVRIGDDNVTSIGGYADWTNVSDERDKVDIQNSEHGLKVIAKLNPIKYRLDPRKRYEEKDDEGKVTKHPKDGSKANEKYSYGFSAQQLAKALKDTDLDIVDDADPEQLGVREGKLIPVLVKAIQELSAEVQELRAIVKELN